jgi:hypothetical protein
MSEAPEATAMQTTAEKLAAHRKKQADKDAAEAIRREGLELEKFELIDRFEKELNGKLGRDFEIVDDSEEGEGFIVVKRGEAVQFRTYMDSKQTGMDREQFILPLLVYPSKDVFLGRINRRDFVGVRCVNALAKLAGLKQDVEAGKF